MNKLIKLINQIDNMEDMNQVIANLKTRRAFLKNKLAREARATFKIGDKVRIASSSSHIEMFGIITDIKIKNAIVDIDGDMFKVPLSIMEAA
tara:strand:- start:7 stop:282 length:276 start_codon:yes stop_codon:yes gene_type:complete